MLTTVGKITDIALVRPINFMGLMCIVRSILPTNYSGRAKIFFIFYIKSNPHIIAGLTVFIYAIFQVVPELPEVICQRQRKRARSKNFFSFFSYVASKLLIFV